MVATRGSAAHVTVLRIIIVVSVASTGAVLLGGSAAWLLERNIPGRTLQSWGDGLWWALTTLTTTGYGDHVPVTLAGRAVAAVVMITGVAIIGGVAAGIALVSARAVAVAEERALEEEAESLEQRLELRLDSLDIRLARIEEQLERVSRRLE